MRHTLVAVVPAANMRYYLAVVVVGFWGSITETHLLPSDAGSLLEWNRLIHRTLARHSSQLRPDIRSRIQVSCGLCCLTASLAYLDIRVSIEIAPKARNPQRSINGQSKSGTRF